MTEKRRPPEFISQLFACAHLIVEAQKFGTAPVPPDTQLRLLLPLLKLPEYRDHPWVLRGSRQSGLYLECNPPDHQSWDLAK